jgi:hypothetical protein
MLPDTAARERAVAVAMAVLKVESGRTEPSAVLLNNLVARLALNPKRLAALVQQWRALGEAAPARLAAQRAVRRSAPRPPQGRQVAPKRSASK